MENICKTCSLIIISIFQDLCLLFFLKVITYFNNKRYALKKVVLKALMFFLRVIAYLRYFVIVKENVLNKMINLIMYLRNMVFNEI